MRPWWQRMPAALGPERFGLPLRVWDTVVLVLLALLADVTLYGEPGGTGSGVLLIGAVAGLIALRPDQVRAAAVPALAVVGVALFGIWRHWWLLPFVGWPGVVIVALKLHNPRWPIIEALCGGMASLLRAPLRLLGHLMQLCMWSRREGDDAPARARRTVPLRVVLVPLVTVFLFLLIFRAANPVVARMTEALVGRIVAWCEWLADFISFPRLIVWVVWLLLFAALIRPVRATLVGKLLAWLDEQTRPRAAPANNGNYLTALFTLVSVNLLFVAYHVTDAVYLYVKAVLPEGITWTDYTHAGCGWLTLGLAVSTGVIGIVFAGALNSHPRVGRLRALADVWAVQNLVLAVSAIRRLCMYIDYSGLTHLRITGLYGSVLVAVGLVIMVVKVHRCHSFVWILHKDMLAFALALVVLAVTPNDWICATYNVARVQEGKPRALRPICLKQLTPEALPPLIALLDYERADGDEKRERIVREGIAAILGMHLDKLDRAPQRVWEKWQGCAVWARGELEPVRGRAADLVPVDRRHAARQRLLRNMDAG